MKSRRMDENERSLWAAAIICCLFAKLCDGQMNYGEIRTTLQAERLLIDSLQLPFKIEPKISSVKLHTNFNVNIAATEWLRSMYQNESYVILRFVQSPVNVLAPVENIVVKIDDNVFAWNYTINVATLEAGQVTVKVVVQDSAKNTTYPSLFFKASVYKHGILILVSEVVGWVYFVAWSVSFYPQIYQNWRRRSVRGLSLDFVYLNWTGFVLYSLFNLGLYAVPEIEQEYLERNPTGLIPVQLNDLGFSVHAVFACTVTCLQCFFYDKGAQTISKTGKTLLFTIYTTVFVMLIVALSGGVLWLDFLIACSTMKLIITLVKYVPQAYLNYARKSTSGWSIGNVLLDVTGGILSMAQMFILAYNSNDWISLFGDYTKFGLGAFSIMFDILFIVQHYGLYRKHEPYEPIEGANNVAPVDDHEDMVTSANLQNSEDIDNYRHAHGAFVDSD